MRAPPQSLLFVVLAFFVTAVGIAITRWLQYTLVEVVFFAVPVGFVAFLCWQALQYHIVRIGDDLAEWDAPVAARDREQTTTTDGNHTGGHDANADTRNDSDSS